MADAAVRRGPAPPRRPIGRGSDLAGPAPGLDGGRPSCAPRRPLHVRRRPAAVTWPPLGLSERRGGASRPGTSGILSLCPDLARSALLGSSAAAAAPKGSMEARSLHRPFHGPGSERVLVPSKGRNAQGLLLLGSSAYPQGPLFLGFAYPPIVLPLAFQALQEKA